MKRILLVDDDPVFRSLMSELLRREGYEVEEAKDGLQAVTAIQKRVPDLVVLDMEMPVMSGYEVVHHVRFDQQLAVLPIIVVTAKDREMCADLGRTLELEYFDKKLPLQKVIERIRGYFASDPMFKSFSEEKIGTENIKDVKELDQRLWEREQRMLEGYLAESLRCKNESNKYLDG